MEKQAFGVPYCFLFPDVIIHILSFNLYNQQLWFEEKQIEVHVLDSFLMYLSAGSGFMRKCSGGNNWLHLKLDAWPVPSHHAPAVLQASAHKLGVRAAPSAAPVTTVSSSCWAYQLLLSYKFLKISDVYLFFLYLILCIIIMHYFVLIWKIWLTGKVTMLLWKQHETLIASCH